jgi:Penicillin binding protein transpeptidase domain/Penicillin-binding Protein dimerisation domain/NTF2-like N-terminal transpeptidase domain
VRSRLLAAALMLCASVGVAGCGSDPKPEPIAAQFIAAIQGADYATAARLSGVDAATLGAPYQQLLTALKAQNVAISLDPVTEDQAKKHATAEFHTTVTPAGYAPWSWDGTLPLIRSGKTWLVQWTPALVHPQFVAGETFALSTSFGTRERAPVLGAGKSTLVGAGNVYEVAMRPARMVDPTAELAMLAKLLKPQGVTAAELQADFTAGSAKPDQSYPIITLRESDFDLIEPQLYALAGVPYTKATASLAQTATFAHALLGRVSAITAEELTALGSGYTAVSQVGQSGVEKKYEQRLAGTPDAKIELVGADGKVVSTLKTFPGIAGQPVTLTIDPTVQNAAETALGDAVPTSTDVTALVAIKPSTGAILAVANRPSNVSFDAALEGSLPPGSTFKVVSSSGLLSAGVTPDTPVPCVPSITVGGEVFHNFQGESVAGTVPFSQDFAISCNTAFISLSDKLANGRLATAAADFGLGGSWQIGMPANPGSVSTPKDAAELASDTIGQGGVAVSPLDMAMVAASVQSGTWRAPQLVLDPAPPVAPTPKALPEPVVDALRSLMAGVVTSGTGATAFKNFPGPPVSGKTGTAETADKTKTDAWFIGFRGDLAFAVVVQNGGIGGAVAAPIAANFLRALG